MTNEKEPITYPPEMLPIADGPAEVIVVEPPKPKPN